MTTHRSYQRVYIQLKKEVQHWENLLSFNQRNLRKIIKDGGLSDQKSKHILKIIHRLKMDFDEVSLTPLFSITDENAESYLTSLPGVGVKTAKCILLYSLNRQVLPVDTHVWRLGVRLELVGKDVSYTKVHSHLETIVTPSNRYYFHVNAISHGRSICLALKPRCEACCLKDLCPSYNDIKCNSLEFNLGCNTLPLYSRGYLTLSILKSQLKHYEWETFTNEFGNKG